MAREHRNALSSFLVPAASTEIRTQRVGLSSVVGFVLLTICLFFAEHHSAKEMLHGEISLDFLVAARGGQVQRQVAYIGIALYGLFTIRKAPKGILNSSNPLLIAMLFLIVWCALSVTWAEEPLISLRRMTVLILMLFGAYSIAAVWSQIKILTLIALSGAVHVVIGVLSEIQLGAFAPFDSSYRFGGTLPWNQEGFLCLFIILAALARANDDAKYRSIFYCIGGAGILFLLLTRSRGSLIGLLIGLLIYALFALSNRTKIWILLSIFLAAFCLLCSGGAALIVDAATRNGEGLDNFTGRAPVWQELLTFVNEKPFTGFGYEDFWTSSRIDYISNEFHWSIDSAHSGYLENLLTIGYPGMVLGISVLIFSIRESVLLYRRESEFFFVLSASLCLVYLAVGFLEAIEVDKLSPVSFYFSLLIFKSSRMHEQTRLIRTS